MPSCNPWDRVVSYYHWLQAQSFSHPAVALAQALTFRDFVLHPQTLDAFRAGSAAAYMRRSGGAEQCSAYIRLEHFRDDAQPLFDHLGFTLDLPRANPSERAADWRVYYDDTSAAAVAEACAEDIARFEYSFND